MGLRRLLIAGPSGGGPSDPYFSNVVALLHFDGTPGSEVFTDVKGHTFSSSLVGTSYLSDTEKLFGPTSCYFTGSSSQEIDTPNDGSSDFAMGTGDFTYEVAIYHAGTAGARQIFDGRQLNSSGGVGLSVYLSSGTLMTQASSNQTIAALTPNTWYRLAFAREGTNLRTYINGTLAGTQTDSRTYTGNRISLGTTYTGGQSIVGHMDEFRVTKGVARYTGASYTLDAGAFPDS